MAVLITQAYFTETAVAVGQETVLRVAVAEVSAEAGTEVFMSGELSAGEG